MRKPRTVHSLGGSIWRSAQLALSIPNDLAPWRRLLPANGGRVPASPGDPGVPAAKVLVTPRPVDTLCQRWAAQGPTPETRSTLR